MKKRVNKPHLKRKVVFVTRSCSVIILRDLTPTDAAQITDTLNKIRSDWRGVFKVRP